MVILILRWLSVPAVFVAVMGICILLATSVVAATEGGCENIVGGTCVEGWHTTVVEWSTYVGIAVAFLTAPFLTSKVAPALKRTTAVSAGVLGNVQSGLDIYIRLGRSAATLLRSVPIVNH